MTPRRLITDTSPEEQPIYIYTIALNAINETEEGDRTAIGNELGNALAAAVPAGYLVNGSWYKGDDDIYVFSTDGTNSEIGIFDKNEQYTTIVNSGCLGFSIEHQISAKHRIRKGCEDVIYWTDNSRPISYFNFSRPQDFYSQDYIDWLNGDQAIAFTDEKWDCSKFRLIRPLAHPTYEDVNVKSGGVVPNGSWNFSIQYLDEDYNPTRFLPESKTVNVWKSRLNTQYRHISGASNLDSDPAGGTSHSGKSIELTLGSLDTRFPFYKVAAIGATNSTGEVTDVFVSPPIEIHREKFVFSGNLDGWTESSVEVIRQNGPSISTAKDLEIIENRLVVTSTKGPQYDICGFQRYASKIGTLYTMEETNAVNSKDEGNPRNNKAPFEMTSFLGDEVIPYGIVYILEDGTETDEYHIPGVGKDIAYCLDGLIMLTEKTCLVVSADQPIPQNCSGLGFSITYTWKGTTYTEIGNITPSTPELVIDCFKAGSVIAVNAFSYTTGAGCSGITLSPSIVLRLVGGGGSGVCEVCTSGGDSDTRIVEWNEDVAAIYSGTQDDYEQLPDDEKYEWWQIYNTSVEYDDARGKMGYWECAESVYPYRETCNGSDYWGTDICGHPLIGTPIRHHRMPDRSQQPHFRHDGTDKWLRFIGVEFFNLQYPPGVVGHYFVTGIRDEYNRTILAKGYASHMTETEQRIKRACEINIFDGEVAIIDKRYIGFAHFISHIWKKPDDDECDTTVAEYYNTLFTPEFSFNNKLAEGNYIKHENSFLARDKDDILHDSDCYDGSGWFAGDVDLFINT
ncbi:MAG TPA: hypothetical protein VMW91_12165, partial [Desulfosporosinus sp.]|nr:hypothetical protein [Desulfosporosinus sp.]